MKTMKSTNLILLPALLLAILLSARAEAALLLNGELTHEYTTAPGQQLSGMVEVQNNGAQAIELLVTQADSAPDGSTSHHPRSNRSWVYLTQDRLLLQPGTTEQISYTIAVPAGKGSGTYWSGINIEPVTAESQTPPAQPGQVTVGVKQKVRYSVSLLTHIGQGAGKVVFGKPTLQNTQGGDKLLQLNLANQGIFHSRPELSMEVFDQNGRTLGTWHGNKRGLFPGVSKTFEIPLHNLAPGQYKALLMAEDANSGRTFGADMQLNIR